MTESAPTRAEEKGYEIIDLILNTIYPVGVGYIIFRTVFVGTWSFANELAVMFYLNEIYIIPDIIAGMIPPVVALTLLVMAAIGITRLWIRWMDSSWENLNNQHP